MAPLSHREEGVGVGFQRQQGIRYSRTSYALRFTPYTQRDPGLEPGFFAKQENVLLVFEGRVYFT